jgi:3-oxoacyl-[acyl-carrier protein] reductase
LDLEGKVVAVTGAGSGIGAATVRVLTSRGCTVVGLDRDIDAASAVAADLDRAEAVQLDVADSGAVEAALDTIYTRHQRLDGVVHVAGVDDPAAKALMGEQRAAGEPLDITSQLTDAQWDRMIRINLNGTFYVVRSALGRMLPAGSGSIVTMSSQAGVTGVPGMPHYSASKAGVLGFTRAVACEVADRGIRVNAIAPGPIVTPLTAGARAVSSTPIPMGRWGQPEEVAAVAAFLISDESSFVTGETINVNGGILTV